MILGQVRGRVVSTAKVDNLNGKKLLVVEVVSVREHGLVRTGREMVCVDAVQAGEGELVFVVQGSSSYCARYARCTYGCSDCRHYRFSAVDGRGYGVTRLIWQQVIHRA